MLASASAVRRRLLEEAGVRLAVEAAAVDEEAVKQAVRAESNNAARAAEALAELKAMRVSARHPGAVVLGCDQMLDCEGRWFDKPASLDDARAHLLALKGRSHRLTSAVAAVRDGRLLWHHTEAATLTMRTFSDAFLDAYLAAAGEAALASVGAYHLEGLGAQLFVMVEGDFFTVLGLPLLAVLDFLRENGELPA
ncbi:MAG: Maf family protein [Magnetospirillum sp.]|nr:Maf family protein [Magnetospirillum sp.]